MIIIKLYFFILQYSSIIAIVIYLFIDLIIVI